MYEERINSVCLDNNMTHCGKHWNWSAEWNNMNQYMEEYRSPLWKRFREEGIKGNHGGMDYLIISAIL